MDGFSQSGTSEIANAVGKPIPYPSCALRAPPALVRGGDHDEARIEADRILAAVEKAKQPALV